VFSVVVLLAVLFAPDGSAQAKATVIAPAERQTAMQRCHLQAGMLHMQVGLTEPSMGELQTYCLDVSPTTKPAWFQFVPLPESGRSPT
jgi:hypothetical protein